MQVTANLNLTYQEKQGLIEQIPKSQSQLNMVRTQAVSQQQELWSQMPEAEVEISKEGRELLEKSQVSSPLGNLPVQTENSSERNEILLDAGLFENLEEDEESDDKNIKRLREIYDKVVEIQSTYAPKFNRAETGEDRLKLLEEIWERQRRRDEKNKQLQQWAHDAKKQAVKHEGEIDKDTADLYIMLKSIEEYEKNKEKAEKAEGEPESDEQENQDQNSVADAARGLAGHMKRSQAKSDDHMEDSFDYLKHKGRARIQRADEIAHGLLREINDIGKALLEEEISEEEKSKLVLNFAEKAHEAIYGRGELETSRFWGQQNIQDVRDLKRQTVGDPQMISARAVSDGLLAAASDAEFLDATEDFLIQAENELNKRVEKLIDERNDIVEKSEEEKEEKDDAVREDEMGEEDGIIQEEEEELEQKEKSEQMEELLSEEA